MLMASVSEITVYLGLEVVQRIPLDVPVITVGRNEDNTLMLRDAKVSRYHLRFVRQPDGTYIAEDIDSANGTWIGDYRIARIALSDGMTLRVGPFTLVAQNPRPVHSDETILPNSAGVYSHETIVHGSSIAVASPPGTPDWTLVVSDGQGERRVPLTGDSFTIGRGARCNLILRDPNVSVRHASIERRGSTLTVVDDGSTNGTFLDGDRITTAPLTPGRVLMIGETRLVLARPEGLSASPPQTHLFGDANKVTGGIPLDLRTRVADAPPVVPVAITSLQLEKDVITIGRDAANDVPLPNPQVSRNHARLRRTGTTHIIEDLGSTNGTFVNGERITSRQLAVGDQIQISVFVITYNGATLQQVNTEGNIRLDAIHLNKWVSETKNLLQDISFSVYPREFVALVGTSGAGKSTLMDALNGQRPAEGSLLINGDNLYANYDAYRTTIGYVPQDDIIHLELSVFNALDYVARLRLPPDTSKEERHAHIESVLKELGLTERRDLPIQRLSGGQRKRVSIGVELLTKPSLFFLDEPTSGLDPATETNMMHLLRQLADQGRTILLITHATKNVTLCDLVIFLAKGGNLAYYGPPNEAPTYFGVDSFEDIYPLLEGGEITPEEWSKRYRLSAQYRTYVEDRLAQYPQNNPAAPAASKRKAPRHAPAGALVQRPSALRQFVVLMQRNAEIMRKNRASLIIVMMQAILVSTFLVILFSSGLFSKGGVFSTDVDRGDPAIATTVLFVMTASGIFIGLSNASKEFVKERHIYRRERAVNLKVAPYLWAKVAVLAILAVIQAAIMIAVLTAGRLLPRGDLVQIAPTYARLYAAYFVTILIGIMFGLLVSSLVNSVDSAVGSIVLVFMPQMIFSGHLLPVERMQTLAKGISSVVAGRWIYDTLGNIAALPALYDRHLATWQGRVADGTAPPALAQAKIGQLQVLQQEYRSTFTQHVWLHWGILGAFFVVTAILIYIALRRNSRA